MMRQLADMKALMLSHRMVAVLRTATADQALAAGMAVLAGGGRILEVTWTVPDAPRVVAELKLAADATVAIGAGTIVTKGDLDQAIAADADFLISPDVHPEMIREAAAGGRLHIPGAMTPTEILTAWRHGAPMVKLFPIASLGGVDHLRAVRGPIPHVPFLVTGGVSLDNVQQFLAAGAAAVGLSNTLIEPADLAEGAWDRVSERTRKFAAAIGEQ